MPTRLAEPDGGTRVSPSGPAADRRRIVASKLAAPQPRPGIVDRPVALNRLAAATHATVVLISAPAGYGKTTLLALWGNHDERPFAWVTLDAADNDPVTLVAAIVASLDSILDLDPTLADSLSRPEPPLEELVLPSLVDACAEAGQPLVLVLDDLHLVTERRCLTAIGYLVERLPNGCQLALATRTDPPLPLASLRAHGRLAELRAADLSLGDDEAHAVLAAAGVHLSDDLVSRLVERAEGWPAAIYLAALSLRDRTNPAEFVDHFTGSTRHVADFLSDDVLARQPPDMTRFLLHTCVLEELTASLCDKVIDDADSDATLVELERSNLFLVPLDEERQAYRYHHLFAQYLRAELVRREPELVPELHRRAWRWYREHGLVGRAVAHAQAAGDVDVAAELVAAGWRPMVEGGQVETMRSWIAGFEDAEIEAHAPLAIAAAWVSGLVGDGDRAAHFAEAAGRGYWDGPMPDGTAALESALAIMSSAFGLGGVSGMRSEAQRAVDLEPATSPWRSLALLVLGVAEKLDGDFVRARASLDEAVRLSGGEDGTRAFALAHLAMISCREGHDEEASAYAERAFAVVDSPGMRNYMPSVGAYSMAAHLSARRGDVEGTSLAVDRAYKLLPRLTEAYWWLMIETRIWLAPALASLGRRDEAATRLDEAKELLSTHTDAGKLPDWHEQTAQSLRLAARRPQPSQELSDAERRILRLLASNLTLREIARELYLSMNTVKTHTRSIYRKLGVSSRAEAVEAARSAARRDSPG